MTVKSININAYGIRLLSDDDFFATITGNDMSNTIIETNNANGIRLDAGGYIGSETSPVIISGNPMTVKADNGVGGGNNAYGILLSANNDVYATITGNDMLNSIWGNRYATGIYLSANNSIGSEMRPVIISGNPMTVTANVDNASGITLYANSGDIFATIVGNDMSNTIWGNRNAHGINLGSPTGNIGSETRPLIISGNPMTVTAVNEDAYGIRLDVANDIFANVKRNYMNITSTGAVAYGGYMEAGNLIGDVTSLASFFYKNSGTVNGATDRYMLYLDTGNPSGGNFVNWAGSSFTPLGGAWSGNYGTLNQLWHNFTLPPDVLTP